LAGAVAGVCGAPGCGQPDQSLGRALVAVRGGAVAVNPSVYSLWHVSRGDALFGQRCAVGDCQGGFFSSFIPGCSRLLVSRFARAGPAFAGVQLLVAEPGDDWWAALGDA